MPGDRDERIALIQGRRWKDLVLVVEEVDDPHNIGAILRTCEAVGIRTVHLIYEDKSPRLKEMSTSASSAVKWLDLKKWNDVQECVDFLHTNNFQILVTAIDPKGKAHFDFDLIRPTAIVLSNEQKGVSDIMKKACDGIIAIPMRGFIQSLNVSVAAAVVMYEALRQRTERENRPTSLVPIVPRRTG